MKKKYIIGAGVNIFIVTLIAYLIGDFQKVKVGYVRSQDLVYSYEGTKEAMAKFNNQKEQWQSNIDTLKFDFERAIQAYNVRFASMSAAQKQEQENRLSNQEQQLQTYSQAISKKIEEEDDKMMQTVLNQINSFVKDYGKANGYDVILGTTSSGSVLYGKENIDLTDLILEELNKQYQGE